VNYRKGSAGGGSDRSQGQKEHARQCPKRKGGSVKILVVDDNRDLADVVKAMLQLDSHWVQTADNAVDGIMKYLDFKPDLVITDIQMPLKDGFALVDEIRTHDPAVKAVYMSGNPYPYMTRIHAEKKHHAAELLGKPFTLAQLKNVLVGMKN
jgi:YesN/AraC family two-component response regulator